MKKKYNYVVIGAGIVGLSTAYELFKLNKGRILVIEKESDINYHQTGRNSGVLHSGIYYKSGSKKLKTCLEGYDLMLSFLKNNDIPYKITGKLIVASNKKEAIELNKLKINAELSKIDFKYLDKEAIKKFDKRIKGESALFIKKTGLTDYKLVTKKLKELLTSSGVDIIYNTSVKKYTPKTKEMIFSDNQKIISEYFVNCAGMNSDEVFEVLENKACPIKIFPFKGQYYKLKDNIKFNIPIYPVPNPKLPFLGIHITPSLDGYVKVGPNASISFKKNYYVDGGFSFNQFFKTITTLGIYFLFFKHLTSIIKELSKLSSFNNYTKNVRKYWTGFDPIYIDSYSFGLRAQAVSNKGVVDDFILQKSNNGIHVLNAPSPAATSAFSISKYIIKKINE